MRYLTENQVAQELQVPAGSLRQDRHRGVGLPYVRIGRRIRYRADDVVAYLDARSVMPQQD